MSRPKSFSDKLDEWQAMVDNLKAHLTDLPNLAADHGKLSTMVTQARDLQAQRDLHKANLRDINAQRQILGNEARKVRNKLAAGVQNAFDLENARLVEFGLKPRARRSNLRLTKLQKVQKAAARAVARAAALAADSQPAGVPNAPQPAAVK